MTRVRPAPTLAGVICRTANRSMADIWCNPALPGSHAGAVVAASLHAMTGSACRLEAFNGIIAHCSLRRDARRSGTIIIQLFVEIQHGQNPNARGNGCAGFKNL